MKVSDLINELNNFQDQKGDVELVIESGDGRSTWAAKLEGVEIRHSTQWYDKVKRWRISLKGAY